MICHMERICILHRNRSSSVSERDPTMLVMQVLAVSERVPTMLAMQVRLTQMRILIVILKAMAMLPRVRIRHRVPHRKRFPRYFQVRRFLPLSSRAERRGFQDQIRKEANQDRIRRVDQDHRRVDQDHRRGGIRRAIMGETAGGTFPETGVRRTPIPGAKSIVAIQSIAVILGEQEEMVV
jgi:hypothetical protein